jgi:cytochrome c oxidase assembly protein subunit 15
MTMRLTCHGPRALAHDFSPLARLLLMGVLVAAGPLAWVWLRHRGASPGRRLQALTLLTLFLTFDLVCSAPSPA